MYKVIKESQWLDSKRNLRNFYSYVRANSIEEATKYSTQNPNFINVQTASFVEIFFYFAF